MLAAAALVACGDGSDANSATESGEVGALECGPNETACDAVCVDLDSDRDACGACGVVCGPSEVCSSGSCELSCGGGTTSCDGDCRDLDVDPEHCGACGSTCGADEVCAGGSCVFECPGELTDCEGSCRDLQTSPTTCGACDVACDAGEVCTAGSCTVSCQAGLTECSGTCVDITKDRANCGECGTACDQGEVCTTNGCALSCPSGQTDCNGTCVDTSKDRDNCGTCGTACDPGEVCSPNGCVTSCQSGLTECNAACVDTDNDPQNCGACGTLCDPGEACVSGGCEALGCSIEEVRLVEVSTGGPDYWVLENPCATSVDVGGLQLAGLDPSTNSTPSYFDLPAPTVLSAGQLLYILEMSATATLPSGASSVNASFFVGYEATPGAAWLCLGPCLVNDASNVLDYVAWGSVTEPTWLSMSPAPVTGVDPSNKAVLRVAGQGASPNFLASDWTAGPPSL